VTLGTLAHQIYFLIPLTVAHTDRAKRIKVAQTLLNRDTVKGMGIERPRANDNALFM
jgi:hypothetical protein